MYKIECIWVKQTENNQKGGKARRKPIILNLDNLPVDDPR
jgi:hypothetical protein